MIIDKLAWLHIRERKVLVARSRGRQKFYLPGGKREAKETDQHALMREIREELAVELVTETITHVRQFKAAADGMDAETSVVLSCYASQYRGELRPSAEIEEIAWFAHADAQRGSAALQMVLEWLKSEKLIG